jgi:anti-sigma factor RsiW
MNETADEELTALLDGQLEEVERAELIRRLAADLTLQRRLQRLAQARGHLDAAFADLLAEAPVARLRAALPKPTRVPTFHAARLAASFVVVALLSAALAAWVAVDIRSAKEDFVSAVVDYMELYTPETFAGLAPDPTQEAQIVAKVGARLGVGVTPADLAAPGLAFKTAFVLSYDGAPLGEFVFTDAAGVPYLFCVWAGGEGPAPLRWDERQSFAIATWGRRNERFLVIGPSAETIRAWSKTLAGKV